MRAKYKDTITATILSVNINNSLVPNIAISQTTTKLEQTSENTFSCGLVNSKENIMPNERNKYLEIFQSNFEIYLSRK